MVGKANLTRPAVAVLTCLLSVGVALSCGSNDSPIATVPQGDIRVEYGREPLSIYCTVMPPNNSSQLSFVVPRYKNKDKVLNEDTIVVNDTTVRLYVENPVKQTTNIECKLNRTVSCMNKVVVDSAPGDVTDFHCRSYNVERFVCKWRTPLHYIKTIYTLEYNLQGFTVNACVPLHYNDDYNCTLYAEHTPKGALQSYRPMEDNYNFTLTSINYFGTNVQKFYIDHFANVIPGKPKNLVKKDLTAHSVTLQWLIPINIADFVPQVVDTRIWYQIKTVDNRTTWRTANVEAVKERQSENRLFSCVLNDLPYAHWSYDVRVFIKSALAPDQSEFWSDFQATTFTTMTEPPPFPPRTSINAFAYINQSMYREVEIYWQQIDEYYESGNNFTYNIEIMDGYSSHMFVSNKSNHLRFVASYEGINVTIASSNNDGLSRERSHIYIPPARSLLAQPTSFTKTVYGNKTYDLHWKPPSDPDFESYTVFWCSQTDVDKCNGKFDFTTLPNNVTSHRVFVPDEDKIYGFAISANKGDLSSGMVWALCNLPPFNATNTVVVQKAKTGSRYTELSWDLQCSFRKGHVIGYNITYCPHVSLSQCSDAREKFMVVNNTEQNIVNVTGLTPHTTYSFHISVIYNDGLGYPSQSLIDTTLEDKPSEPVNPLISEVTSDSIHVSWDPPKVKNGIIKKYLIKYYTENNVNDTKVAVVNVDINKKRQEFTLHGLKPFMNYTVIVVASTTLDSDGIVAGRVRTNIGKPGRIGTINLEGSTLSWSKPSDPGGYLDYYEVQITNDNTSRIEEVSDTMSQVPLCGLSLRSNMKYRVRAINLDGKIEQSDIENVSYRPELQPESRVQKKYEGEWSDYTTGQCVINSMILIVVGVLVGLVLAASSAFYLRKLWIKIQDMKDIEPVLPKGLGPPIDEKDAKSPLGTIRSPPPVKEDKGVINIGDKALLLPPNRSREAKESGSTDTTESTTLSLASKEQREQACSSDEASDTSSVRDQTLSAMEDALPTIPITNSNLLQYKEYDNGPSGSDGSADSGLASTSHSPSSHYIGLDRVRNIPPGYVIAEEVNSKPASFTPLPQITPNFFHPLTNPKPMFTNNICTSDEWKASPETTEMWNKKVPLFNQDKRPGEQRPMNQVNNGYVQHTDKLINKHLNIKNAGLEDPALPDPNMSPDAYCRFGHSSDFSLDSNLE